ncbi:MAG: CpsD/CapB family tyrosine-protein kinase [Actinobacteria bacterium]|nr:MAG: CpsD/CapB family tyrosine-protein kinase [Actinomycetota bacterium]
MNSRSEVTRAFDGLASRIDASGFHRIGFTSAVLGEGVSTTALGTALSLAALREETVVLIDANWLEPSLTADAAAAGAPGLADLLAKKVDLAAVVRPASHAGLAFVPVGDRSSARPSLRSVSSLIASKPLAQRTIVVDLPPILAGEPFVLPWAALLDQLFVVLREAATPLPLVRQALARLGVSTPEIVLSRAAGSSGDPLPALRAAPA